MIRAITVAVVLAASIAGAGCAKQADHAGPDPSAVPKTGPAYPAMPEAEVKRSQEACTGYVDQVCGCAKALAAAGKPAVEANKACDNAHALPEAVRIGLEVAAYPDTSRNDAFNAQESVRKTARNCIELTAKLPTLGCDASGAPTPPAR